MNSERPSNSHATAWTLSLLAVPVLYVLTFPFVVTLSMHYTVLSTGHANVPKWLRVYGMPLECLMQIDWAKKPLEAYFVWSVNRFKL